MLHLHVRKFAVLCQKGMVEYVEALFTGRKEDSESVPAKGTHGAMSGNFYYKVTFKRNSTVRQLKGSESEPFSLITLISLSLITERQILQSGKHLEREKY